MRSEFAARGTRLVSLRIVSAVLAREVERERRSMFIEVNQKIAEARARLDSVRKQAAGGQQNSLEREVWRAEAKLAEIHGQKALKLFPMIAVYKRVVHPYLHLNGEASMTPPAEQPEQEHTR
jgi:hypothetical protein